MPLEDYLFFLAPQMVVEDRPTDLHAGILRVLERIMAMPEERRPDVVLIPDDFLVAEFHRKLLMAQAGGLNWNPHLIYIRHRQLPFFSPKDIPGDYFESDLMKYAELAVQTLLSIIRGDMPKQKTIYTPVEYYPFRRG